MSAMYDTLLIILLMQVGYDRRVRPSYGGSPVSVGVSLYVLSISDISEKFMDFTFDMYFRSVHTAINIVHIEYFLLCATSNKSLILCVLESANLKFFKTIQEVSTPISHQCDILQSLHNKQCLFIYTSNME